MILVDSATPLPRFCSCHKEVGALFPHALFYPSFSKFRTFFFSPALAERVWIGHTAEDHFFFYAQSSNPSSEILF